MAAEDYREWLMGLVPGWLQRTWGGGYLREVGSEMDELTDELMQARKAMMPNYAGAGPATDALARIGWERGLERGPTETDGSYGERLRQAWLTLPRRGSPKGLLGQLRALEYDYTVLFYVQRSGRRVTISGALDITIDDGDVWTFGDGKPPEAYAQFGLLFTADQPDITWSEADGFSDRAAQLNRVANRWKPAKAEFMGTWIMASGAFWGHPSTRTWGSFDWGGTGTHIPPR